MGTHGTSHEHEGTPAFDRESWDERYRSAPSLWSGRPNPQLVNRCADLEPGTALDVGAGEGADAIWLAQKGWTVTAVDISEVALERGRIEATARGHEVAEQITWHQADLTEWSPPASSFDLVSAQYFHLPSEQRIPIYRDLAAAVRPGGALLVVAHDPSDMGTTIPRPKVPDLFFTGEELVDELGPGWLIEACEAQPRMATDPEGRDVTIHDAVVMARRAA